MAPFPRLHPHAVLDALAPLLPEMCDPAHRHPRVVRARERDGTVELGLLELPDGCHPSEVLTGMVVPPEWTVAGVLAVGTAHDLSDRQEAPVGVAYLLDRSGRSESRVVHLDDGSSRPIGGAAVGLLPDLVHRALGLATPAPDAPARRWLDLLWLDRLVAVAAVAPGALRDRAALRRFHPLHDATGEIAADPDWGEVRAAALTGEPPALATAVGELVATEVVDWHDEGSLSRALVAELPPRSALLGALDEVLAPPLRRVVRATCSPCPRGVPDRRIRPR